MRGARNPGRQAAAALLVSASLTGGCSGISGLEGLGAYRFDGKEFSSDSSMQVQDASNADARILDAAPDASTPVDATVWDSGATDARPADVVHPDAVAIDADAWVDARVTCAPGSYAAGGACSPCPDGTFSSTSDAVACTPWRTCSPGNRLGDAGSATRDRACAPCGAGTYSATTNAAICSDCAAGTTSGVAATSCVPDPNELRATTAGLVGAGLSDCGGGGNDVCARSPLIAGGTFHRGAGLTFPATVSSFRLDKYEVTVGRFRKFVDAWVAGWRPAAGSGKHIHVNAGLGLANTAGGHEAGWESIWTTYLGAPSSWNPSPSGAGAVVRADWDTNLGWCGPGSTWTSNVGENERRPLTCASAYDVHAFCVWDGGFIPSEAEWEYASAGGAEERAYPWGNNAPGADASLAIYGCYHNGTGTCSDASRVAPVGSAPLGAAKWGHLDLAGNVSEWAVDWHRSFRAPCTDCASLSPDIHRVLRGGSYPGSESFLATESRSAASPAGRIASIGGRCARAP